MATLGEYRTRRGHLCARRAERLAARDPAPRTRITLIFLGLVTVGTLTAFLGVVVTRRDAHTVGVLLTWVGCDVVFFSARDVYYRTWLADPSVVPLDTKVIAALDESAWWLFAAIALLLLYFPSGRLPSRRWRAVPALIAAAALGMHVTGIWAREPFGQPMQEVPRPWGGYPWPIELLGIVCMFAMIGLGIAAGVSLVARFRRATGTERLQLKWLSLAGLALALYPVACGAELLLTGETDVVAAVIGALALVALPVSVALAMLRHDLYDVDRVLADTISYVAVVVVLVATYTVSTLALGIMLGRDSAPAAAGATAICALLLAPLRTRLRRTVDRRLFPPRRAALQAIEDLQRRVHTQDAQPEELESVLRTALRDPALRVGMLVPGASGFVDSSGGPVPDTGLVPVSLGGVQIGVLSGSDATGPGVLRVVASACASLVELTRLRAELAGALREVEASRTRLIQVGDAERRRLERDLHDGAQQRLVSLGHGVAAGPTSAAPGWRRRERAARPGCCRARHRHRRAPADRPWAAADQPGRRAARRPLRTDRKLPIPVHLDVVPDQLDDDVATTAYFVAAEAITNAAKYANASAINVRVAQTATEVEVRVQDDGIGGATARAGSGLSGLADRVAAIGGSLRMTSPVGSGTTIEAVLPCGS